MKVKDIFPIIKGIVIINKINDDRRYNVKWFECIVGEWNKKLNEHSYYKLKEYFECEVIEIEGGGFDLTAIYGYGYDDAILITIKEE